jgi:hypothetical protein
MILAAAHPRSKRDTVLAAEVAAWDVGLSVDLEYNRWNRGPLEVIRSKYLEKFNPDESDRNVFPDLIVHNRSGSSREHNILVLEAKHSPSEKDREFDYRKLTAFRREFFYQQAVFLEFPRRGAVPCWQWIIDECADPSRRPARAI